MVHALGLVFGCVARIDREFRCMWFRNVVGLVVGLRWVDNVIGFGSVVGLVVRRMMKKLIGVGQSNILGQT